MAEETPKRTCPKCAHENETSALICVRCGTPLRPTTYPVSERWPARPETRPEPRPTAEPKPETEQPPASAGIALWVRNDPLPVLLESGTGVVLGRQTDAQKDPAFLVDLSRYSAYRLGVSRRHAQIEIKGGQCLLLDLGSSNGTWVNGLKVRPYQPVTLQIGDRINLAQLEILVGPLTDEARARVAQPSGGEADSPADKATEADQAAAKPAAPPVDKPNQAIDASAKPPAPAADKTPQAAEPPKPPTGNVPQTNDASAKPPGPTGNLADAESPAPSGTEDAAEPKPDADSKPDDDSSKDASGNTPT